MAEADEWDRILGYLEQRFGIPGSVFDGFLLFARKKSWWLLRESRHLYAASQLKAVTAGLRAFQRVGRFLKPTTRFIQIFGHHATKSLIHLDASQLDSLKTGNVLPGAPGTENGYVIFIYRAQILGLGLQVDGRILSQLPRKDVSFLSM